MQVVAVLANTTPSVLVAPLVIATDNSLNLVLVWRLGRPTQKGSNRVPYGSLLDRLNSMCTLRGFES